MDQNVRKIRTIDSFERVETGALQVDGDWPGLFIRGDQCIDLYNRLWYVKEHMEKHPDPVESIERMLAIKGVEGVLNMIKEDVLVNPKKEGPNAESVTEGL